MKKSIITYKQGALAPWQQAKLASRSEATGISLAVKIPIKHPNQKRLEDALEKLKDQKRLPKKKKEVVINTNYKKPKKSE